MHPSGTDRIRVGWADAGGGCLAASLPAGTPSQDFRLTPEPAPLVGEKGMQSWFGEQYRVCLASPTHLWGRNYHDAFRNVVLEKINTLLEAEI